MNTLNHKRINYNKVFDHRPRLARYLTRQNKKKIVFILLLKRHVFHKGGAIAPNSPPQLRHCFLIKLFIKKETVVQVTLREAIEFLQFPLFF